MKIQAREIPHKYRNKHLTTTTTNTSSKGNGIFDIKSNTDSTLNELLLAELLTDINKRLNEIEIELFYKKKEDCIWRVENKGLKLKEIIEQNKSIFARWYYYI